MVLAHFICLGIFFFYSQEHGIKLIIKKRNSTYPAYFKICNPTQINKNLTTLYKLHNCIYCHV